MQMERKELTQEMGDYKESAGADFKSGEVLTLLHHYFLAIGILTIGWNNSVQCHLWDNVLTCPGKVNFFLFVVFIPCS